MERESIKCKDYIIIKIRTYADGINIRKIEEHKGVDEQWERAKNYNKFFWDFVKKITGKKPIWFYETYMLNALDCTKEEMQDDFGIIIAAIMFTCCHLY